MSGGTQRTEGARGATGPGGLPMGVGRVRAGWLALCALLLGVVAFGAYGYLQQRLHGDVVTGLRTVGHGGAAWGLYICCDVVFVGLAFAGVVLTAVTRLFRIRTLWPLTRMAEVLSVISLAMAGLCVIADLGRPLTGLINLPRFARTGSPFFGTFTLVIGVGLTSSLVYLLLDGRADAAWCAQHAQRRSWFYRLCALGYRNTLPEQDRHRGVSFWLSMFMLPMVIVSYSTLGFVFGIQAGRPGWFSPLQAPGFVILAALSGLGVLLGIAALARWTLGLERELPDVIFRWLGTTLGLLTLLYLYVIGVEELTARYTPAEAQHRLSQALVGGPYAPLFWSMIACFVAALLLLFERGLRHRLTPGVTLLAAVLVNAGALIKRYLIVVPSQTHGALLPWPDGSYTPSWVELSVVAAALALGTLLYLVYAKVYPILPLQSVGIEQHAPSSSAADQRDGVRKLAFLATLVLGLAVAGAGLALSARIGHGGLDPLIPFSPVMFIMGIALSLGSAVVYELVPARRATASKD